MRTLLTCLTFLFSFFFINSQGLIPIDDDNLEKIDRFKPTEFGFSQNLPAKFSLEKFVPLVLNQGPWATCVGFAMAYYGMSTIHNTFFNRTTDYEKFAHSFDPLYAYTLTDSDCNNGLDINDAVLLYTNYGSKKNFFSPDDVDCNNPIIIDSLYKIEEYLKPYMLKGFEYINPWGDSFVEDVKKAIFQKLPVIISLFITESLKNLIIEDGDAIWLPKKNEVEKDGHAMCLIGYDDEINGGSFRIVNSWGADWADSGFFWMSYNDFIDKVFRAYVIRPSLIEFRKEKNVEFKFNDDYVNISTDQGSYNYEGPINGFGPNGQGIEIIKSDENNHASVGSFIDGKRNGTHLLFNESSSFIVNYQMGEIIESKDFGFVSTEIEIEKKMLNFGYKLKIKNPTKRQIDSIRKFGGAGKWKIRKNN